MIFLQKGVNYLPARINLYHDPNSHQRVKFLHFMHKFLCQSTFGINGNWKMVTNNLTVVIKVALIDGTLSEALLKLCFLIYCNTLSCRGAFRHLE